jgi:Na+-translocating ferredoxin:NAD+ oxidoreductase RnfD subunit
MSSRIASPFPHTFQPVTVRGIYIKLTVALVPLLLVAIWRGGTPVVMTVIAAIATGAVAEFLVDLFRTGAATSSPAKNGRVLYLMVLLAVLVPVQTSPIVVAIAAAATVLIGVYLMGGTGVYYVHPVFIGLMVVAGGGFTTIPNEEAAALASLAQIVADSGVYQGLTDSVFVPLGMRVPPEALALLINVGDAGAVSVGAALIPPLILGALFVFGEDLVPPAVVVAFLLGVVAVLFVAEADIIDLLVRSNVLIVLVFALADPSVRPMRAVGMAVFGVASGVLSAVLLVTSGAAVPVITGVVLVATIRPLLDQVLRRR